MRFPLFNTAHVHRPPDFTTTTMPLPIRCLITAGPTREFIDPVRFISNPSSGKMGYALAQAAVRRGWSVDLVSGPVELQAPEGVRLKRVVSGQEMFEACCSLFDDCDVLIMCAAVMDMRPKHTFAQKQKKEAIEWRIEFEPVVDILKTLAQRKTHQCLIGFAAETQDLEHYARRKLEEKQLDWIVANDVSQEGLGFASDQNRVQLFSRQGESLTLGPASKPSLAVDILEIMDARGTFTH